MSSEQYSYFQSEAAATGQAEYVEAQARARGEVPPVIDIQRSSTYAGHPWAMIVHPADFDWTVDLDLGRLAFRGREVVPSRLRKSRPSDRHAARPE